MLNKQYSQKIPLSVLEDYQSPTMHPLDFQRKWNLTQLETAIALGASIDTIKSWGCQRRNPSEIWFKIAGAKDKSLETRLLGQKQISA